QGFAYDKRDWLIFYLFLGELGWVFVKRAGFEGVNKGFGGIVKRILAVFADFGNYEGGMIY
ncbi:MAG: hypothetical protein K8953_06445, partial [Proteobacteria bacterium]|nr:hypothetical protein [Pseudomonadota bacterium]